MFPVVKRTEKEKKKIIQVLTGSPTLVLFYCMCGTFTSSFGSGLFSTKVRIVFAVLAYLCFLVLYVTLI